MNPIKALPNQDIRDMMSANKIQQWKVANKLGRSEVGFGKLLRGVVTDEQRQQIVDAVDALKRNPRAWID